MNTTVVHDPLTNLKFETGCNARAGLLSEMWNDEALTGNKKKAGCLLFTQSPWLKIHTASLLLGARLAVARTSIEKENEPEVVGGMVIPGTEEKLALAPDVPMS